MAVPPGEKRFEAKWTPVRVKKTRQTRIELVWG
jgi:hypothetical protein